MSLLRHAVDMLFVPPSDTALHAEGHSFFSALQEIFPGLLTLVACILSYWYFYSYKPRQHRLIKELSPAAFIQRNPDVEFDVVVIGGGSAGYAALKTLAEELRKTPMKKAAWRVALIEEGEFAVGDMVDAPQYRHDMVGSVADRRTLISSPFVESGKKQRYRRYPRGCGLGGTSALDWHISLLDSTEHRQALSAAGIPPPHLSVQRNPLSWAFAESCKAAGLTASLPDVEKSSTVPQADDPIGPAGLVFPLYLDIDSKGHNRSIFRSLPGPLLKSASSAPGATRSAPQGSCGVEVNYIRGRVVDLGSLGMERETEGDETIRAVSIETTAVTKTKTTTSSKTSLSELRLAPGGAVVLCAGVFGSAKLLLRREAPAQSVRTKLDLIYGDSFNDAIAVPLIYEALPGITDDATNIRTLRNLMAWYAVGKGPLAAPITDTAAHIISKGAGITILFESSGGYSKQQFSARGIDPSLGVFKEAFTFWVVLSKLEDNDGDIGQVQSNTPDDEQEDLTEDESADVERVRVRMPSRLAARAKKALVEGIRCVRRLVQVNPLRSLSTGREAIDTLLFPQEGAAVCRMLYAPKVRKTRSGSFAAPKDELSPQAAERLRLLAESTMESDGYLSSYVDTHARYFGFGCGSLSSQLRKPEVHRRVPRNCTVGDLSASAPGPGKSGIAKAAGGVEILVSNRSQCPLLVAGSSASACVLGRRAALEAARLVATKANASKTTS